MHSYSNAYINELGSAHGASVGDCSGGVRVVGPSAGDEGAPRRQKGGQELRSHARRRRGGCMGFCGTRPVEEEEFDAAAP